MNTTTIRTTDVTQRMTDVATALASYSHLPSLARVHVWRNSRTYLGLPHSYSTGVRQELTDLCAWAEEFDTPVAIELSYHSSGEASIEIDLAGYPARLAVTLDSGQAYELGAALRHPISPEQPTFSVTPGDLLAAIGGGDDG